jgi:putative glutamine amidotransferase
VLRLAGELRAVAWHRSDPAGDPALDLIEGIEAVSPDRWVVGVQWHPENLVGLEGPAGLAAQGLFRGYLAALEAR